MWVVSYPERMNIFDILYHWRCAFTIQIDFNRSRKTTEIEFHRILRNNKMNHKTNPLRWFVSRKPANVIWCKLISSDRTCTETELNRWRHVEISVKRIVVVECWCHRKLNFRHATCFSSRFRRHNIPVVSEAKNHRNYCVFANASASGMLWSSTGSGKIVINFWINHVRADVDNSL